MERISTRLLDELGRIVLPSVSREALDWGNGTALDIFEDADNRQMILRQALPCCVFCKGETDLHPFGGKYICGECLKSIRRP